MTSLVRIEANRANARLSTGPRSAEGKTGCSGRRSTWWLIPNCVDSLCFECQAAESRGFSVKARIRRFPSRLSGGIDTWALKSGGVRSVL